MTDKLAPSERHKFVHDGQLVYEWDQTFNEVNIYVQVPAGIRAKQLYVNIETKHLKFGITPSPPYLDGEPWASAIQGHELDPYTAQLDQQRLLLERFQQEHPGFDFSGAAVTGQVPNPRTFMGGVDSS